VVDGDDFGVQGRPESQRELLDAEWVAGHLLKAGSVFAFLSGHRAQLFPDEMFADLFPSGRGRPSVPADVMASVITLQALPGLSDAETVDAVTFDVRWKAACGLAVTAGAFHATTVADESSRGHRRTGGGAWRPRIGPTGFSMLCGRWWPRPGR
jgi:Transposase domain (DUF772)